MTEVIAIVIGIFTNNGPPFTKLANPSPDTCWKVPLLVLTYVKVTGVSWEEERCR